MSTTTHPGKCKFCGYVLQLEIDDDCPVQKVNSWKAMAACNRCADFRMACMKLGDAAKFVLGKLHDSVGTKKESDVRQRTQDRLVEITKRLMRVVCEHHKVECYWEDSIVSELMDNPHQIRLIFNHMIRQVSEYAKRTPPQPSTDREEMLV